MEIGRDPLTGIRKLIKEKGATSKKVHLSNYAQQEVRGYLTIMYGKSFRREGEKIDEPLRKLLGYPVQIHSEPTNIEYWIEHENS
jgi:hypothetical protein